MPSVGAHLAQQRMRQTSETVRLTRRRGYGIVNSNLVSFLHKISALGKENNTLDGLVCLQSDSPRTSRDLAANPRRVLTARFVCQNAPHVFEIFLRYRSHNHPAHHGVQHKHPTLFQVYILANITRVPSTLRVQHHIHRPSAASLQTFKY